MNDTLPNRRIIIGGAAALAGAAAAPAFAQPEDAAPAVAPDLSGKSVLITGASSGFGRLSAEYFARAGATVIASMRNLKGGARPEAKALTDFAKAEDLKLKLVELDVTDDRQVDAAVKKAEDIAGGALDAVLNNAGIGIAGPIELHDHEQLMKQFNVNLFGYHRVARAALPAMRAKGEGLLLQVSSQLGRFMLPNLGVYSGTKFAIEAMFEAMAYELAPFGVECCIIQPGGYPTKIWENGTRYFESLMQSADDERKAAYAAHIQMAQGFFSGGGSTDPMDVPRAIADIIAMPAGSRPLRKPVHPNVQAVSAVNAVSSQVQAGVLGNGAYAKWHAAVSD